ncbi:MAG TPA: sigma 54-interacting transcriptional regulator [Myxococcota bacterium]|nr:sigma 54-interacting transcriptional regulator [Myxococcota bacterium]
MIDANEFFKEATKAISSNLKIDTALHRLLLVLQSAMPTDEVFLGVYDPESLTVRIIARALPGGGQLLEKVVSIPRGALATIARRLEEADPSGLTFILPGGDGDAVGSVMAAAFDKRGDYSALARLLFIEGQRAALLVLYSAGPGRYTAEHARLIDQVNDPLSIAVTNALRFQELVRLKDSLEEDNRALRKEMHHLVGVEVVGAQFGLRGVMELARKVAPLGSPVLLLGETGSGKDVIANAIHRMSARRERPFVKANCGAIPASLIDSELFGHERGAFTGAVARRRGLFERADRGTLFLDEIGELPMDVQSRLLRVLQTGEYHVVGGSASMRVDVRLIAASNRDLRRMVQEGRFREDLWYRLNVFPITLPPLRERLDDLPSLVHHFLQRKSAEQRLARVPPLGPGALQRLLAYPWPGNVRELQNVIERALILSPEGPLSFADLLPLPAGGASGGFSAPGDGSVRLDDFERCHIQTVLGRVGGRVNGPQGAAELLGIHPNTLRHRMRRLGIPFGRRATRP